MCQKVCCSFRVLRLLLFCIGRLFCSTSLVVLLRKQFLICDGLVEKPTTWLKKRDKKDVRTETQGGFPVSRNFYERTCANFTHVNKIEPMYERVSVNVKVEPYSTFLLAALHTLLHFTYASKNSATVEIHWIFENGKKGVKMSNYLLSHYLDLFIVLDLNWKHIVGGQGFPRQIPL